MSDYKDENTGSKAALWIGGALAVLVIGAAALYLVDVDQTKEARLPGVEVEVESGQMPKFDVDVADVNVGSTEMNVKVPTVGVETETKTIEVEVPVDVDAGTKDVGIKLPTIDIERPREDDPADNPN